MVKDCDEAQRAATPCPAALRLMPGICCNDEPVFNIPRLGKNHIRAWQDREWIVIRSST